MGKPATKGDVVDLRDCPLALTEFQQVENSAIPRYSSVLRRSDADGVGMEDIDSLQLELESLLSAVVVRKSHIKEEMSLLQNIDKIKGKNRKGPGSPGKRAGGKDASSSKKLKLNSGKPLESGKLGGIVKSKNEGSGPSFDPLQNEQIKPLVETNRPTLPKNEIPNKFWNFVEPYCAPIQQDDVKFLEDLIKTHSDLSEYNRVPPLGQHYAIRWAREDLEAEKEKGKSETNPTKEGKEDLGRVGKKAEVKPDGSPFGELTQRLVQGLIEENLMTSVDDNLERGRAEEDSGSRQSFIQSLKVTNGDSLEKRVKKELEEQGILDPNEEEEQAAGNDEIKAELVRCQAELRAVSQHNLGQLKRLVKSAREEMARQEVRARLAEADKEVCEAYRRIAVARSKKKSPSKKEREMAWKALKEREAILKQLEAI